MNFLPFIRFRRSIIIFFADFEICLKFAGYWLDLIRSILFLFVIIVSVNQRELCAQAIDIRHIQINYISIIQ